jgi:hypothetical protein
MSPEPTERPFDSIESAQDFLHILHETVVDAMHELHRDHQVALRDNELRRAQALELAMFKVKILTCHLHKSRRALNDLRMLRRLILNERATVEQLVGSL